MKHLTGRTLNDMSVPGRRATRLPDCDVPRSPLPDASLVRKKLPLPEVSEVELVRYFTHLSTLNYSVETGLYPLGSCTMKYNPKRHEDVARMPGFAWTHPLAPEETVQGALQVLYELQTFLAEITGMAAASLAPMAGAQGELAGMLMIRAYHQHRGDTRRQKVLAPDSAHGTNPATAAMAGYQVVAIRSDERGNCDLGHLRSVVGPDVAGMMLTQPNTLGLFDSNILEIAEELHRHGALLYGDGANMNALLGRAKPGTMGFDVLHLNLHKTFSTPHGGRRTGGGTRLRHGPSCGLSSDAGGRAGKRRAGRHISSERAATEHRQDGGIPRQLWGAAAGLRLHPYARPGRPAGGDRQRSA